MEKAAQIILSNSVEQILKDQDKPLLHVINPFITINPQYFPTQYTFSTTILTSGIDMTGNETMEIKVIGPVGESTVFSTGKIPSPKMDLNSNITMNLDFKNVDLKEQGKFTIEFYFNGDLIAQTNFYVHYIPTTS